MKLVVACLAAVALVVITASSCSVEHKSADYVCTLQTDCTPGRLCVSGYCIVPSGMVDAPKNPDGPRTDSPVVIDSPTCPPQCTSCNVAAKTCTVDCGVTNCTGNAAIVCPTGYNCAILCTTNNACGAGINCETAASCSITCSGQGSCRGIDCGTGDCDVKCQGQNSCRGVDCSNSCACDVTCAFNASCEFVTCNHLQCDIGRGCTSAGAICDTCP